MKHLISLFIAVSVAFTAFGQSTPPNKLRSNDSFTQVDNYLVAAKRLGIPSGPSLTLDGTTTPSDAPKLFWRTSDSTLHVYVPALSSWLPAGGGSGEVDLSNYFTKTQVDSALVLQTIPLPPDPDIGWDRAFNIRYFGNQNKGVSYSVGAIDLGITLEANPHLMGPASLKMGIDSRAPGPASVAIGTRAYATNFNSVAILGTSGGESSVSIGDGSSANGDFAVAIGNNSAPALRAVSAGGLFNRATGEFSGTISGSDNEASGTYSASIGGVGNLSAGWGAVSIGEQNRANAYASLSLGRYSDPEVGVENSYVSGSPAIIVGSGTSPTNRSNAYVLNNDGTSTQYGIASYGADYSANFTDRSLVDKGYVDSKSSPFNLIDVTQSLYTDKAINVIAFDNTGMAYSEGSIDFGITRDSTHTMGLYAFKQGVETTASGTASTAFGLETTASGSPSTAFGVRTTASGSYSTAFGDYSTASGSHSTAFGVRTTASGSHSAALGYETTASGPASTALGYETTANEYASLAIGRYSTDGAVETAWTTGSPIFKVGNGTSAANRSNAYVLYNDGRSEQVKDIEVTEIGQGVVIKSPDGTRWRITVDNTGILTTTAL